MKSVKIAIAGLLCLVALSGVAQPKGTEVIRAMERANDYFLAKYPDPGKPTFVKKERPSNLWTRGVYFEGLMALTELERQSGGAQYEPCRKYIYDWGAAHQYLYCWKHQ